MLSVLGDPRESDKKEKLRDLDFQALITDRSRCVSTTFAQVIGCSLSCKALCTAAREPG